ncbi:methanol oxidation system protein MoxJ [Methylotenera sp.]|uniref:methanol oxidation system protein MoxJ n=1 Tax=Methylotenera sp. TaxID=2051956 RepID=UPI00272F7A17|nr:methanol oxidation system protein MoxJ [Methylotenera sp.]MDP2072477.1 methanol oxidation system protein MoxJ [Methylotenera sp.]MDP2229508.1 methanol oxidation system protein MoxJ [Methylotenera sp.]MDP3006217.1 methanol oxidation system protein MoxJ [Methylotenera sp.]MDP3140948.1 methanol oxidation system protein MoxJ [Methylotenera sp.]MDZ4212851.1 methanol oxidation system protein MoxJ [Methylotenera sp.]
MKKSTFLQSVLKSLVIGAVSLSALQARAADLNICAGENEMPYSNLKKEGFENNIAEIIGKALNRKVNFVFWKDARLVERDYLNKGKCDVMMGVDKFVHTDPRMRMSEMLKTDAYYKSAYVFITRKDREIDISSWNDDLIKERNFRIGVTYDSPGKVMLLQKDRFDDMFDYFAEKQKYQSTRNRAIRVDPQEYVNDVATKHIHTAMLWAADAGRYVKESKVPLKMQVIKDDAVKSNGEKVPMHYEIAMGVRKADAALLQDLNRAIKEKHAEIEAVLKREGIPLLPISGG